MARAAGAAVRFGVDQDSDDPLATRHFLAGVAAAVGTISAMVILAMWIGA